METPFNELIGKTLLRVEGEFGSEEILFTTTNGERYKLYHDQDCCESVYIDDIVGDLEDIVGSPILSMMNMVLKPDESCTWTFYRLRTIKGFVTIKWYGTSDGYCSEAVYFVKL